MNPNEINSNSIRNFATASLILGVLSTLTFWTGILPFVFGGLSILFAVLSRREDRPFPSASWWGIAASCIGLFMGALILYFAVVSYVIPMMTDPAFYQEMNTFYQNNYGISLDELLQMQ